MTALRVPDALQRAVVHDHGEPAAHWIDGLPGRVTELMTRWGLSGDGEPMAGGTSLVLPVRRDARPAALKVMYPLPAVRPHRAAFDAVPLHARPLLFEVDETAGAMLLERLTGNLSAVPDQDEAIEIAGELAAAWALGAGIAAPRRTPPGADRHGAGRRPRGHPLVGRRRLGHAGARRPAPPPT